MMSKRDADTFFKRFTAETYYKILQLLGGEIVFNHADYRLLSCKVLQELANYGEVNLFLRGLVPMIGFRSTTVSYERHERIAGSSHYPLSKMLKLAFDGITSLSITPIRIIDCKYHQQSGIMDLHVLDNFIIRNNVCMSGSCW